jgi:hypothetical protein
MDTRASNKHRPAGPPSIVQAHAQARASIAIDFHRFPSISTTAARSTDRIKRVTRFPVMVVAPGRRSAHYVNSLASLFFFFFCFLFSFVPPGPPPAPCSVLPYRGRTATTEFPGAKVKFVGRFVRTGPFHFPRPRPIGQRPVTPTPSSSPRSTAPVNSLTALSTQ